MSETAPPRKDGHDLRKLIDARLAKSAGRCWLAQNQMREYGLTPETIGDWARDAGYDLQLPLFAGGLYELRRVEP